MGRTVAYRKQTIDTPNPIARFAHRQRYKFSLGRVTDEAPEGGTVVDYGCGDGDFLTALSEVRPDLELYGFDPGSSPTGKGFSVIDDMTSIGDGTVDVVCCYETLEHLYAEETATFLDDTQRVLHSEGKVSISVPIIGGPPLLLKELNRRLLFRKKSDYQPKELLAASFLGKPAPRPENRRVTHKGFDFRSLAQDLSQEFGLLERHWSPFPHLPWWLNSQAFCLFGVC